MFKFIWAIVRGKRVLERCEDERDAWGKLDAHPPSSYITRVRVNGGGRVADPNISGDKKKRNANHS